MRRTRGRSRYLKYIIPVSLYDKSRMKIPIGFVLGLLLGYTLSWTIRVSFELPDWSAPGDTRRMEVNHLQAGDRIGEVKRTILNDNDKQAGDKQHRSAHSDDPFEEFYKNVDDVEPVNEADEESDPSQRNSHVESRESTPPSLQVITVTRPHECKKGRYLIGVLIAEERLLSMAYAIHATWGNVDGVRLYSTSVIDAMHFPSGVSVTTISTHTEMKLVGMLTTALPLANDTDWLVLVQDTVYIQVEKLEGVLGDMDSAKEVYFGLSSSSSHCSFRSAIVISRTAFAKLSLKLDECSSQFSKLDGDVEGDSILGQCMKSLGITCTIPTQKSEVFYDNKDMWDGSDLFSAHLTEHAFMSPVDYPKYIYRLHIYFQLHKLSQLREDIENIRDQIDVIQHFVPTRLRPQGELINSVHKSEARQMVSSPIPSVRPLQMLDILNWEFFNQSKILNALGMYPSGQLFGQTRAELKWTLTQGLVLARKSFNERVSFVHVDSAYRRVHPVHGLQYVLDFVLKNSAGSRIKKRIGLSLPFASSPQPLTQIAGIKTTVNFLTTISRVGLRLKSFLVMFGKLYVREDVDITLTIVLFRGPDEGEVLTTVENFLKESSVNRNSLTIHTISGTFARGVGLAEGFKLFKDDDLVFVVDIDLLVDSLFLDRCQLNTIKGKQVYFPIFFKLYNKEFVRVNMLTKGSLPIVTRNNGHWAHYSYGMLCIYARDYLHTSGYKTELRGWGEEDIHLVNEVLREKFEVFRSPDPGLIHIWHDKTCDPTNIKDETVLYHCRRSKAENIADRIELAHYLFNLWSEHPELKPEFI